MHLSEISECNIFREINKVQPLCYPILITNACMRAFQELLVYTKIPNSYQKFLTVNLDLFNDRRFVIK